MALSTPATATSTTTATRNTAKAKKTYKSWLKDGVNGGPSSMDVLVGWLANTSNYAKWRGGSSSISSLDDENNSNTNNNNNSSSSSTEQRTPKKILLEEIIENMRQVGIYHRHPKDVASKISTLQSNYRSAREWNETEGRRLRQAGFHPQTIHEELLKRFPYWDTLNDSFSNIRSSPAWPMSISSIMDRNNDDNDDNSKEHQEYHYHSPPDEHPLSPPRRRRRVSDGNVSKQQQPMIEPELTQRLVDITDEKESDKAETSQEPTTDFLRERRTEREQLMFEKEKTRRIRAQADLVKNLVDAGFSKQEIAEQLKHI
ncbi:hypothetical protein RO3G_00343 [Lichtheimia corymbifera JMRC:FSU:9682]|uniref:Uncharacterized protein n=1 Tax=Lichtheimia corymbifera JMRC:FSU:9682 TaxID=1263082 RepID=A0A068RYM0_9FUNG|nr:hypothetical protein RO3G_00343 [Lichtheimia corymbifera JMRC:FSU:9682]